MVFNFDKFLFLSIFFGFSFCKFNVLPRRINKEQQQKQQFSSIIEIINTNPYYLFICIKFKFIHHF